MPDYTTLRVETTSGVRSIWLARPDEYNTITPALRDELGHAVDEADADNAVRVILLRADGPAFCAGYGLDWATPAQAAGERQPSAQSEGGGTDGVAGRPAPWIDHRQDRVWDSIADYSFMKSFVDTYMKLWYSAKPTIAAVQGWCIGGGTDLVLCADIIIAGDGARFGYPPSRVWGTPTTAMWVYRLGLERAKRYLLTGDEISATAAAGMGMILESVADDELQGHAEALARRMALVPTNQLMMLKLLCNQTAENMGMASSRQLGTLFDGIARHTQEGLDFVDRSMEVGFRQAVRERDDPFGDYGSKESSG
jgi:enoyl-CoA hydratase